MELRYVCLEKPLCMKIFIAEYKYDRDNAKLFCKEVRLHKLT